ncbi:MAG: MBL fold metallo-hydrolase [Acidimicrobiales bacterium]
MAPARAPRQESLPPETIVAQMAPGVLRCQLPVDMPGLGHVNAYLLLDGRGAALVDAGVPGPSSWEALIARLDGAGLRAADIHTVVVTHSHPDHFGGAHRLAGQAGALVVTHGAWQTRWAAARHSCADPELDSVGVSLPDVDPADIPTTDPWAEPTPWGGESFVSRWVRDNPASSDGKGRASSWLPPEPDRIVADGEDLELGGRRWRCLYTPGHTLDHLCLYDPEDGVLLSGDHVLPTITPHIPGIGGGRDSLASYLASLERVAGLPVGGLVLPAHGQPFADLARRVGDIRVHHEGRLDRLCEIAALIGPATVADYSRQLFREERWGPMAESEAYAHLQHLYLTGRLVRAGEHTDLTFGLA